MTVYKAYFDGSVVRAHQSENESKYRLGMRFVGTTKTEPVVGSQLQFEESLKMEMLLCAGLSLHSDPRHNPGTKSQKIKEIKDFMGDECLVVDVADGSYLLVPIK